MTKAIGTKFQLKLTTLSFWTKFTERVGFWLKTEKMNVNIEF